MNQLMFFPSLYDPPYTESIWGSVFCPERDLHGLLGPQPWPGSYVLLQAEYDPLQFYSPPPGGDTELCSELDDVCELHIRLKEIEVLLLLGELSNDRSSKVSKQY